MERVEASVEEFNIPGALSHLMMHAINMEMKEIGILLYIHSSMVHQTPFPLDQLDEINTFAMQICSDQRYEAHGTILPVTKGGKPGILLSIYRRTHNFLTVFWDAETKDFTYDN